VIHHRLPQIGLQRTIAARLEGVQALQRLDGGFLDDVGRVTAVTCPSGQPTRGPSPQDWQMVIEHTLQRVTIAGARPAQQIVGIVGLWVRTGVGRHRSVAR